jgi:hypothetical protein
VAFDQLHLGILLHLGNQHLLGIQLLLVVLQIVGKLSS